MPKIEKIGDDIYKYKCTCGYEITMYMDKGIKPDRLSKCWKCCKKFENDKEEKNEN